LGIFKQSSKTFETQTVYIINYPILARGQDILIAFSIKNDHQDNSTTISWTFK